MGLRLYLMRHAKSSWKNPVPDRERPLKKRGKRASETIGRALAERDVVFDKVVSSDAKRALETAKRVLKAMGKDPMPPLLLEPGLYGAGAEDIVRIIRRKGGGCQSILLVGHNPGISEAAVFLTAKGDFSWLPTGSVVGMEFPVAGWNEIAGGKGEVILALYPGKKGEK